MYYLSIEVIIETGHQLTLYGLLASEEGEIVSKLVVGGDDGALSVLVELRPSSSPKDLQHI